MPSIRAPTKKEDLAEAGVAVLGWVLEARVAGTVVLLGRGAAMDMVLTPTPRAATLRLPTTAVLLRRTRLITKATTRLRLRLRDPTLKIPPNSLLKKVSRATTVRPTHTTTNTMAVVAVTADAAVAAKQLFGNSNNDDNDNEERENTQGDFKPEADVFDTESSYVIHVSLPGAKKEDVGVSWDAEKSEISISGVVHRPGDEEFIKTLALNERKVGPFERKIRLGSRANPAQVDDDAITAKLEDGILRVEVPKLDKDYVEIKKVDIL
ncbi:putative heat shock protein 42 [Diplodia seriata]|uniref:Putative heat shock protein 42 n=1 Tax=Diplodia seriata TaxID=420778 RepID=A0A0G2EXP2_9PEZI|nr:putative heat shock protein 42 [Diplodia seriata]